MYWNLCLCASSPQYRHFYFEVWDSTCQPRLLRNTFSRGLGFGVNPPALKVYMRRDCKTAQALLRGDAH